VRFSKQGKVRWTSHRDVARMWERALRRAAVPVAVTEGFSPRPRLSFGLALSTGYESLAEYLDIDLAGGYQPDLDGWPALLSPALPVGIDVLAAVEVDRRAPSLQQDVTVASWSIELVQFEADAAARAVDAALATASLVAARTRKGHEVIDDLRPGILHLAVVGSAGGSTFLSADLATQPRSLRPAELVGAVFAGAEEGRVVRTHQWIDHDGARTEPIPLDVAPLAPLIGVGS
jgi:radical SAM-linked protein